MSRLSRLRRTRSLSVNDDYGIFPNRHAAIKLLAEQHNSLLYGCIELEETVKNLEMRLQDLELRLQELEMEVDA